LCICKLARYSQGNFVLVTGKVREFYIVRPVGTLYEVHESEVDMWTIIQQNICMEIIGGRGMSFFQTTCMGPIKRICIN